MKKTGIIYLMSSAIEGVYKIGISEEANFSERMRNLEKNGYSNIVGLKKEIAIKTENYEDKEKMLHEIFSKSRIKNTEFFATDQNLIEQLFYSLKGEIIYPEKADSEAKIEKLDRERQEDVSRGYFVETVKNLHQKNPNVLFDLLGSGLEFKLKNTKIKVLKEPKIGKSGATLTVEIDDNLHIYANYSRKDLVRAINDYEQLYEGKTN